MGRVWEGDFAVLGVETSCDDTAAAVVHSDGRILGESKRSQNDLNQKWGGVVPGLARDAHQEAISQVLILILFLLSLLKRVEKVFSISLSS